MSAQKVTSRWQDEVSERAEEATRRARRRGLRYDDGLGQGRAPDPRSDPGKDVGSGSVNQAYDEVQTMHAPPAGRRRASSP